MPTCRCGRSLAVLVVLLVTLLCTGYEYIINVTIATNYYAAYVGKILLNILYYGKWRLCLNA